MARHKSEFLSAVVVVGLGIFFLLQAYSIESFQEALIGPRLVPMQIAGLIIGLGVLQFAVAWLGRSGSVKTGDYPPSGADDSELLALSRPAALRMVSIIAAGFAYVWLFSATGYLIATTVILALLLVVFGTRSAGKVAVLTIVGAAAYYTIFIKLMGIHDPAGWLIDIEMLGLS